MEKLLSTNNKLSVPMQGSCGAVGVQDGLRDLRNRGSGRNSSVCVTLDIYVSVACYVKLPKHD
jgi:hypothetical protein